MARKRLQKQEGKSLGRLVSDLLAEALTRHKAARGQPVPFRWVSRSMRARVELSDKEALYSALDGRPGKRG